MVRKFLRGLNILFLLLIIISTFCSCTNEMNMLGWNNNEQINFFVSVPSWKGNDSIAGNSARSETRATPITDASLGTDKTFGIIADIVNGSNYTTEINQEVVSYNTTNKIWETVADHYWPGANKTVNFYAYYPASITNGTITHTAGTTPTLTYNVPTDAATQADIMTSTGIGILGTTYSSTSVSFKHILAAVKFNVGTSGMPSGTIKSISITGVKTSGTYTFDHGWVLGSSSTDIISSPSITITGTPGASITSGTYTFLMIPQIFTDATITVTYSNGGTLIKTISGTWEAGKIYAYNISYSPRIFNYTGNSQSYSVPVTGTYKIECWGASAYGEYNPGRGGYTMGYITLTKGTILYVYVGQQGEHSGIDNYNGGGLGETGGGGASDIRLTSGLWNDFSSLKSRIMVAGGGGGGYYTLSTKGGVCPDAGGLTGTDAYCIYTPDGITSYSGHGGTQTAGGKCGSTSSTVDPYTPNEDGHFGWGGFCDNHYSSGGGGGYYGGGHGVHPGAGWTGGGGGSSFISGYAGCNAINPSSTSDNITHTGSPNHYSGYVFINSQMIAGNASMTSPSGGTETGHTGNGYVRITFISAN